MSAIQTNYQALVTEENEAPHESVIFHAASEGGKSHWNHIGDLDSFFRRVYNYHQKHGYLGILLEQIMYLVLTCVIVVGLVYGMNCIHFNFDSPSSPLYNKTNLHLDDIFIGFPTCSANFGFWTWLIVIVGIFVFLYKSYKFWHIYCCYSDIKLFYSCAMKMNEGDIKNITWSEVQKKLRVVQHEQQMCVHKSDLTELDIYHRVLRHKNYMVAMVNKNILPLKFNIKFIGEWIYLSSGLQYNIELLLFGSFSSPFKETGKLKEEYKKYAKRKEAADELSKNILIFGIINAVLAPFIFVYQLLYSFVTYSGVVKHTPSFLSTRKWSLYSRLYLRHFNELDHELHSRLSRAYKPSRDYMKSFSCPEFSQIAKFIAQISGSIVVFFGIWGIFIEKLFLINHVFVILTCCTIISAVCLASVPHEHAVIIPRQLMNRIIGYVHYVPDHFKTQAHTDGVRYDFSQLFQYTFVAIFEETISCLVTPYILIFHLRHRALDIVDFFRSFTVDVAGVGDVCSFALMNVSKHGNRHWLSEAHTQADQHQQAEDGKTELSLIHFHLLNPEWQPPPSSNMFINDFREKVILAKQDPGMQLEDNPYYTSLYSLSSMGSKYASLVDSLHNSSQQPPSFRSRMLSLPGVERDSNMRGAMSQAEGPPYLTQGSLLASVHGDLTGPESLHANVNPLDLRIADMSFSALYMHDAHQRQVELSRSQGEELRQQPSHESEENNGNEEAPLLDVRVLNYVQ